MNRGELAYAICKALDNFHTWNDATGCFTKGTSYYYECQGVIEDAVKIGAKIACEGITTDLSGIIEGEE